VAQSYIEKYADEVALSDKNNGGEKDNLSPLAAEAMLKLAIEVLDKDVNLAISLAERTLRNGISYRTLIFLNNLRRKNAAAANNFFPLACQSIVTRRGYDVNEMLLLYAYAFSSPQVLLVTPQGLALRQIPEYQNAATIPPTNPETARQYLQILVPLLLSSERYTAGLASLKNGLAGDLLFIRIIQSQVSAYTPQLYESLAAQQSLLLSSLTGEQRSGAHTSIEQWNRLAAGRNGGQGLATIDALLKRADELPEGENRDSLYYKAAAEAVRAKDYEAALSIVGKVSNRLGEQAKALIAFSIAVNEVADKHLAKAEALAVKDTDVVRRAYLFNLIAHALITEPTQDLVKAGELLSEIERLAGSMENGREKVSTLIGCATNFSRFDAVRASEAFREAIRSANKIENFDGETAIFRSISLDGFAYYYDMYQGKLNFWEMVQLRGRADFSSTLVELNMLQPRIPRLKATIILCRTVLSREAFD
jgi:hypothetical protein